MSFHTTIARLREAAAGRVRGEAAETCQVQREDLRIALHVLDRLDSDLRQAGVLSQGAVLTSQLPAPDLQAAATRLTKLAQETRAIYGQETCAGGEPGYPCWTDDALALAGLVRRAGD
ncbi:hypothetical protein [Achromobacter anxifer]|uniref:hypothetical protein n=1 Tax=Achromobacter anxifer TaxID=1287737 RepID=UPI001582A9D7|nr:hypothetical protein [Achromobacter anxifer]